MLDSENCATRTRKSPAWTSGKSGRSDGLFWNKLDTHRSAMLQLLWSAVCERWEELGGGGGGGVGREGVAFRQVPIITTTDHSFTFSLVWRYASTFWNRAEQPCSLRLLPLPPSARARVCLKGRERRGVERRERWESNLDWSPHDFTCSLILFGCEIPLRSCNYLE